MQPTERREPRPGHQILGSGREVYDVAAHIERAFEGINLGAELTVREIVTGGRRDEIPESKYVGTGPIAARLTHNPPGDVRFKYNGEGTLVGFKIHMTHRVGTNMVHYQRKMDDGTTVTSIQVPGVPVKILGVHIQRNLDDGVDVTVEWENV